jgi:membrane-associated phospholipid phosphatase
MERERGRAPLIPDFLWPWVVPIVAVCAVIVAALSAYLWDKIGPTHFERRVLDVIYDAGVRRRVYRLGLEFGAPRPFAAVVIALLIWAAVRRSPTVFVACLALPASVLLVEEILKPLVDRTWELPDSVPTYPSGTATGVAAWTTLVWLLAVPSVRSTGLRIGLAIALGAVTALTAVAVVGAHRHLPLDSVGGVAVGVGFVLLWAALIDVVTGAHRAPARAPDPVLSPD